MEEIISLYLFKRLVDDLGSSTLGRKVIHALHQLFTTLITLIYITKEMHVELFLYLSLKAPFTMTIPIYYMICQSDTYMGS